MWEFVFGLAIGCTFGFTLAGIMASGKAADEDAEALEQILRREP